MTDTSLSLSIEAAILAVVDKASEPSAVLKSKEDPTVPLTPRPVKPTTTFEAMEALDIRLCRIEEVSEILKNPKKEKSADNPAKAYKFLIDTGLDRRECVCNLVHLAPEVFKDSVMPFILNLPEATIRGVLSRAMVIAAADGVGGKRLALLKVPEVPFTDSFAGTIVI